MKAVNYYIIVEKLAQESVNVGGLELTDKMSENRYIKANIISAGEQASFVKEGDVVYYDRHAGHQITFDGKVYQVIKTGDIVIVE
jgi:co-chaperonin GroES (HSP10)